MLHKPTPARWSPGWFMENLEELIGAVALIIIVASVSWGVITRYITEQPATWASEIANLAFAWLTFFGASACIKYRLHPSIDMLTATLPARLQRLVAGFNHLLLLSFYAFMTWFGARFAIESWNTPTAVLQWPQSVLYAPVAVCSALMIVRHLQVLRHGMQTDPINNATRGSHVG
jgi:TRAP-type C4-dicarboxylate transport system permease small subunit